ncbi:gamma-glutamyl-gamma-aminobutyrate hydrolase family protein [Oerskovia sp. M15]
MPLPTGSARTSASCAPSRATRCRTRTVSETASSSWAGRCPRTPTTSPLAPALRGLLQTAVASDVPTLAICLGAQLLAVAGGGHVQVAAPPGLEGGLTRVFWKTGPSTTRSWGRSRAPPQARASGPARSRSACTATPSSTSLRAPPGSACPTCTPTRPSVMVRRWASSSTLRRRSPRSAPGRTSTRTSTPRTFSPTPPRSRGGPGDGRLLAESFLAAVHDDVARRGVRA